jgi:hypothetical protein
VTFDDITFRSHGVTCRAWHFRGAGDAFIGPAGRPIVVMAHGFGGTRDAGLQPFAVVFLAGALAARPLEGARA